MSTGTLFTEDFLQRGLAESACLLPGPAFADCRSNTFGSVTQTQCDDGSSYNSFEMNKQTIINGTDAEGRDTSGMFEGEQQLSQFASVIAGTLGVSGKANPLPKRACIG